MGKKLQKTLIKSDEVEPCIGCLFLDSGAHSLYSKHVIKKGHKSGYDFYETDVFRKYVDDYAEFIKKHTKAIDFYVNVDIIFNPEKSWEMLKYLENIHGLKPLPVIHWGTSLKWIKRHLDAGYDFIGLGGLGQEVTSSMYYNWADKVYEYLCPGPSHLPIVRTHGFAMTAYDLMIKWPWYCMTENHTVLTQQGWKGKDDIKIGDMVLTFFEGKSEWQPVLEVPTFEVEDAVLWKLRNRNITAFITDNHQWCTCDFRTRQWSWKPTNEVFADKKWRDLIPRRADYIGAPKTKKYTDELVELLSWVWTDGNLKKRPGKRSNVVIHQSQRAHPDKVQEIRDLIARAKEKHNVSYVKRDDLYAFELWGHNTEILVNILGADKIIPLSFVLDLTQDQLELFIRTSLKGDGHVRGDPANMIYELLQKGGKNLEVFRIATILAGKATSTYGKTEYGWALRSSPVEWIYPAAVRKRKYLYTGTVWCIRVKNGAFFTKCNESVYVTGNSVDSASWVKAGGFGQIFVPHKRRGKFTFEVKPYNISVSSESPSKSQKGKHVYNISKGELRVVKEWLEQIEMPYGSVDAEGKEVEYGVTSNHAARKIANLKFFQGLVDWLPKWPWPFYGKAQQGFF